MLLLLQMGLLLLQLLLLEHGCGDSLVGLDCLCVLGLLWLHRVIGCALIAVVVLVDLMVHTLNVFVDKVCRNCVVYKVVNTG